VSLTPRCSRADPFGASGQESLDMLIHILVLLGFIAMALLTRQARDSATGTVRLSTRY
jgi:hypothetical protein